SGGGGGQPPPLKGGYPAARGLMGDWGGWGGRGKNFFVEGGGGPEHKALGSGIDTANAGGTGPKAGGGGGPPARGAPGRGGGHAAQTGHGQPARHSGGAVQQLVVRAAGLAGHAAQRPPRQEGRHPGPRHAVPARGTDRPAQAWRQPRGVRGGGLLVRPGLHG